MVSGLKPFASEGEESQDGDPPAETSALKSAQDAWALRVPTHSPNSCECDLENSVFFSCNRQLHVRVIFRLNFQMDVFPLNLQRQSLLRRWP